jgi:transcriptional regulator
MYLPAPFEESRTEVLHDLMRQHPLATFITQRPTVHDAWPDLEANLVPFVLAAPLGTLQAHVARNNPLVHDVEQAMAQDARGLPCLLVFQGPQHYISPSWYASKADGGRVVPTWNYVTVHVWGRARLVNDAHWLMHQLNTLTQAQEQHLPHPWGVADAPADYLSGMLRAIVGVEVSVERLQGKWKVSQNRPVADRHSVHQGLLAQVAATPHPARAMAEQVAQRLPSA